MKKGDVIRSLSHREIDNVSELINVFQEVNWMGNSEVTYFRNQQIQKETVSFK